MTPSTVPAGFPQAASEDLAHQLLAYSTRKCCDNPERSEAQLGVQVALAVRKKVFGWGLWPAETEWAADD